MFFKVVTFRNKDGSTRQYLHLVEAVREGKKVRHKVLITLGRVELLRASGSLGRKADALNRLSEKGYTLESSAPNKPKEVIYK